MNYHKKKVCSVFDRVAPHYGEKGCSYFSYFGERLVALSGVQPKTKALDIATGKGAVLLPLAKVIGPEGKVIGVDISTNMLQECAKKLQNEKISWADIQSMDAEELEFPNNSFDFVFCGFALFFFPDLSRALEEMKRVLKPGGTLVVSIWGGKPELTMWVCEKVKELGIDESLAATLLDDTKLQEVLTDAQFADIQVSEETKEFCHATPEEWWDSLRTHSIRAAIEKLSQEILAALKKEAIEKAIRRNGGDKITELHQVFYGIAKKP